MLGGQTCLKIYCILFFPSPYRVVVHNNQAIRRCVTTVAEEKASLNNSRRANRKVLLEGSFKDRGDLRGPTYLEFMSRGSQRRLFIHVSGYVLIS